jgi:2-hydroxychromene-2-carboxylate isomerase
MIEQGMQHGPFLPYPAKLQYMWRDLERRASPYKIEYSKPSIYPLRNVLPTAIIGRLAQQEGWCAEFTKEVFRLHWTEDVIIGTDENIVRSLKLLGKQAESVVASAQTDTIKQALRTQTEKAKEKSIFGSPTLLQVTRSFGELTGWKMR